ncbi:hypothetical protein [Lacticaseibacillus mingshuiensis]|uniref:hypothetical protein n=1 Tax=Lacticaseibacillus mingshuiensis TaxID=2799574 RepID=UPI0019509AB5|nr:hypothetical protein [Lacticaseibacillus mingshuiensis]
MTRAYSSKYGRPFKPIRPIIEQPVTQLRLDTNLITYGPKPLEGVEVGQTLIVKRDGTTSLTRLLWDDNGDLRPGKVVEETIDPKAAAQILDDLQWIFNEEAGLEEFVTDSASWKVEFTIENGDPIQLNGYLPPMAGNKYVRTWEREVRAALHTRRVFLFGNGHYQYKTIASKSKANAKPGPAKDWGRKKK